MNTFIEKKNKKENKVNKPIVKGVQIFKKDFRMFLFLVLVSIVFIPLIANFYINNSLSEALITNVYTANREIINRIEDIIEIYLVDLMNDMKTISEIAEVKKLDKVKMKSILIENVKTNPLFRNIFVADSSGDIIYNTSGILRNIKDEEYFEMAINGNTIFSEIKISEINGRPLEVSYTTPIKVGEKVVGVLVANLDIRRISTIIEGIDTYKDHNTFIVDNKGMLVAHKNWDRIRDIYKYKNFKAVQYAMQGLKGEDVFEFKGKRYLATYCPVKNLDYSIITLIPYNVAFYDVVVQKITFMILTIITLISVIIIAFILSEKITRPLYLLNDIIGTVTKGNLDAKVDESLIKRDDQFGQLANSFNIMMKTIRKLTYFDPLTELYSRRYFKDKFSDELSHSKCMCIMFLDLDNFKYINDTWGHPLGDKLLKHLANRLNKYSNNNDVVARMGGDEFIFLINSVKKEDEVRSRAEKIINIIKEPFYIEGQTLRTTASMGIVFYPKDAEDEATLLRYADIAMYKAKEKGGDRYEIYTPKMGEDLERNNILRNDLHSALENQEFFLCYQPLVNINTSEIVGMETLIRWKHPKMGVISPGIFIPLAEDNRLIIPIGEWVLKTACRQNKEWQDEGYEPITVSVNISAQHFILEDFTENIKNILNETGLSPKYLEIEITESVALKNKNHTIQVLKELKDLGVKVALDDFGTGYSSLSYLTKFSFDTIKIDKLFINSLTQRQRDNIVVSSIISIGKILDLKVIAEGVEREDQLEFLKNIGCDTIQGYLYSPPIEPKDFERFLIRNKYENYT